MRFYDGVETVLHGSLHSIFFAAYPGTSTVVEVVSPPLSGRTAVSPASLSHTGSYIGSMPVPGGRDSGLSV